MFSLLAEPTSTLAPTGILLGGAGTYHSRTIDPIGLTRWLGSSVTWPPHVAYWLDSCLVENVSAALWRPNRFGRIGLWLVAKSPLDVRWMPQQVVAFHMLSDASKMKYQTIINECYLVSENNSNSSNNYQYCCNKCTDFPVPRSNPGTREVGLTSNLRPIGARQVLRDM